jgi:hypothetical protein
MLHFFFQIFPNINNHNNSLSVSFYPSFFVSLPFATRARKRRRVQTLLIFWSHPHRVSLRLENAIHEFSTFGLLFSCHGWCLDCKYIQRRQH